SSFAISGNNLVTNGTVAPGSYAVCILATQAGATNSPSGQAETITASSTAQTIASINVPTQIFTPPAAPGTTISAVTATMNPASPLFSGTFTLDSICGANCADSSKFTIVGTGNNSTLQVAGATLQAATYHISIIAQQSGAPTAETAFTITGTSPNQTIS